MTKKVLLGTLGLALIFTLLGTPGFGSASTTAEPGWLLRTPATAPGARFEHAMAYDSARGVTVLFGGQDGSNYFNETWEWDGSDWLLRTPATAPGAGFDHAMAYDAARGVTVLFVGHNLVNETWEWDGSDWVQRTPETAPLPRVGSVMAYDSTRGVTVLFGGNRYDYDNGQQIYLNDTWEWDGINWVERTPLTVPPGRVYPAMVYDAARGVTVLFGGYWLSGYLGDTWEWNGTDWVECTPSTAPSARYSHKMAYDSARGVTVLFGGADLTYLDQGDTWEWDGTTWVQRTPATAPSARSSHAMAYDSARGVTVLFAGSNLVNDTWEYPKRWVVYLPLIQSALSPASPGTIYQQY